MNVLGLTLLGGLVGLDGVGLGQFMLSRPLVAGWLAGVLVGDPATGAAVGALLEVYLIVAVPTGGARFPEPGTATIVAVAVAVLGGTAGGFALGVGAGLVWGRLGGISQVLLRRLAARLVPLPGEGRMTPARVVGSHLGVLALDALRGAAVTSLGVGAALALVPGLGRAWPLGAEASRALVFMGAFVSLGILARGDALGARRLALFGIGVGAGLIGGWLA